MIENFCFDSITAYESVVATRTADIPRALIRGGPRQAVVAAACMNFKGH